MNNQITFTEKNLEIILDDLGNYTLERVELISALIQQSDAPALLAKWRAEDRTAKGPGGRPGSVTDHAVLVLVAMLALENKPLHLTLMARIVTQRMNRDTLDYLGISNLAGSYDHWYARIQRELQTLLRPIDSCPMKASRSKRLTQQERKEVEASRDPVVCAMKQERLDFLVNSILEATWQGISRDIRREWKGNTSVDATVMSAFGQRGTSKSGEFQGMEPDAAWWGRDGDHKDDGKRKKSVFGWDVHLAVTIANDPSVDPDFPIIALGMATAKPGTAVAENTVKIYKSMHSRGHHAGLIVGDMVYFAGQNPDKFHLPLAALGHRPVTDYKIPTMGATEQYKGARLVEGQLYCPSMPKTLVEATIDYHNDKSTEDVWRKRIAQRERYAFKLKGKPDKDGYVRMLHPTIKGRSVCKGTRKGAPACCKQVTITVTPEFFFTFTQPLVFGSDAHIEMYGHGRNCVETFNAYVKDESKQALGVQNRRRVRGYAAQTLLAAFLIAAANVRKIYMFLKRRRIEHEAYLADPTKKRAKRRTSSLQYFRRQKTKPSAKVAPPRE